MKIIYKKLNPEAKAPRKAHVTDAAYDLFATSMEVDQNGNVVYGTGLAMEIPKGFAGLLFPRSSIAKKQLLQSNSVGVIDSGYRGEIKIKFKPSAGFIDVSGEADIPCYPEVYETGEYVGQLMVIPALALDFFEVDELSDSDRGEGGFGSTGK